MKLILENTTESRFIEWLNEEADGYHLAVAFLGNAVDENGQDILNTRWYQVGPTNPMCFSFDSQGFPSFHTLFGINCNLHKHPKVNIVEAGDLVPLPEGEMYLIDMGFDGDHCFNIFLEDMANSISVDFGSFDSRAKDNLSDILDGITSKWPETKAIIDTEWFGIMDDINITNGKSGRKSRKSRDISIELDTVVGWGRVKDRMTLEEYLGDKFGFYDDGKPKVARSTFYGWVEIVKERYLKSD